MASLLNDPQVLILGKFVIALVLGAAIGFERELASKPAGLRTHMIVVGVACLIVSLNNVIASAVRGASPDMAFHADPLRVVQGLIMGISFVGAGTIIRRSGSDTIEGLTTAASILLATAIGIYVGFSQYIVAVGATMIAVIVLHQIPALIRKFKKNPN
ncbi:MAG: MgtC/SapB family protein [Candidatus Omnitrophota bacterium]